MHMSLNTYDQLWSFVQQHMHAIAVTLDSEGLVETTQVQHLVADTQRNVWFLVNENSSIVETLSNYPDVCLVCSDVNNDELASLSGIGVVITDTIVRHALWSLMDKPDPDRFKRMALIRFSVEYAECRDAVSNQTLQFVSAQSKSRQIFVEPWPELEFNRVQNVTTIHFNNTEH